MVKTLRERLIDQGLIKPCGFLYDYDERPLMDEALVRRLKARLIKAGIIIPRDRGLH